MILPFSSKSDLAISATYTLWKNLPALFFNVKKAVKWLEI
jgi:hypothetical protein